MHVVGMEAIGTEGNEGNKGGTQNSARSDDLFVSFVAFCSKQNGQALFVCGLAQFGQDDLQLIKEPIDLGSCFGVEFPGIRPAAAGGGQEATFDKQVLFNRQKAVESGLKLEGDDCADRKGNAVSQLFVPFFHGLPERDDAIDHLDGGIVPVMPRRKLSIRKIPPEPSKILALPPLMSRTAERSGPTGEASGLKRIFSGP
jgi:hypothetical protein